MLRLMTLGGLSLKRDGAPIDDAHLSRRRLALLAALAAAGPDGSVSRDRLLLLFWPERTEEQARSALKQMTFALRKSLHAESLFVGGTDLRLNSDVVASDVGDLLGAAMRGDHRSVVAAYNGPFLDGIHLDDAEEFERWADEHRRRIEQLHKKSRIALADGAEARGDHEAAVDHWRALALLEPLDATVARRLVAALAESGNAAAALLHAREYEALAQRELGVALDPALATLVEDIASRHRQGPVAASRGGDPPVPPAAVSEPGSRRRTALPKTVAALALVLIVGGGLAYGARDDADGARPRAVLVLPFENTTHDSSIASLGAMAADWVATGLSQTGVVSIVSLPPAAISSADSAASRGALDSKVVAWGTLTHASEAVIGRIYMAQDTLWLEAKVVDPKTNEVTERFGSVAAPRDEPLSAVNILRQRIMGRFALRSTAGFLATTERAAIPPTYAAYRAYLEAIRARSRNDYPEVVRQAVRAYRLDTAFLTPLVEVVWASYSMHECARVDSVVNSLESRRSDLRAFDELYMDRMVAWCHGDYPAAFAAAERLVQLDPNVPEGPEMAGRSALHIGRPRTAISYMKRVDVERGTFAKPWEHFRDYAAAYHQLGDHERELDLLREGMAYSPGERSFQLWLVHAFAALGRWTQLDSLLNEARTARRNTDMAFVAAVGELRRHGDSAHAAIVAQRFLAWTSGIHEDSARVASGESALPLAQLLAGETGAARATADSLAARYPRQWRYLALAGVAAAMSGATARARECSAALARLSGPTLLGRNTYGRAQIAAALGDREGAVRLLEQAVREGVPYDFSGVQVPRINDWDPLLQSLDGFAPFERLLSPKG